MEIYRTMAIETENIMIGDRIEVALEGIGNFLATVHAVEDHRFLIIFDEYITKRPMNEAWTNNGGFEASDLKKWMDTTLKSAFPEHLRNRLLELTLPSIGHFFGHEDSWCNETFEPDTDEQLPLMKDRANRVAYRKNQREWGWLRNATKKNISSAHFADVGAGGSARCDSASLSNGVRPAAWLDR